MGTLCTLDDYVRQAVTDYTDAGHTIRDAIARKDKARDTIITFLDLNEADTGTDPDGRPIVRVSRTDREIVDVPRLKALEPFTYRRYLRTTTTTYIRVEDVT